MDGTVLSWFCPYLSGRTQRVFVDGIRGLGNSNLIAACHRGLVLDLCYSTYLQAVYSKSYTATPLTSTVTLMTLSYIFRSVLVRNSISQDTALMAMEDCIADIKQWTQHNCLMLNDDKTEFMIIGTHQQLAKVDVNNIRVGDHDIRKSRSVRDLVAWFDEKFAMSAHVTNMCSSAFFALHNLRRD